MWYPGLLKVGLQILVFLLEMIVIIDSGSDVEP